MIRDRLVIGIRDSQLSERLQMESDLSLQKADANSTKSRSVTAATDTKTPVENKPQLEAIKQQRRAIKTRQPRLPPLRKILRIMCLENRYNWKQTTSHWFQYLVTKA